MKSISNENLLNSSLQQDDEVGIFSFQDGYIEMRYINFLDKLIH